MPKYRGRFAPSPTGPLHFGSMVAAMASFVDARQAGGDWLIRIEDIDEQRLVPGASDQQLRMLEAYGLKWDGTVVEQSTRKARHAEVAEALVESGHAYPCACSRTEISAAATCFGADGPIYPGTCRGGMPPERLERSLRIKATTEVIAFDDRIAGPIRECPAETVGDFVIRRADGFFAYQLACVVDDADQGITHVVRGGDLLGSTARQIGLQRLLGVPTPYYAHVPLVVDATGRKLSKQSAARPVRTDNVLATLGAAWHFLGQGPLPNDITNVDEFWPWAIANWRIGAVDYRHDNRQWS